MKTQRRIRLIILLLLMLGLLGACSDSKKQNNNASDKNVTIGIVNLTDALSPVIDGFKAGMEEQEYVEGENITYVYDGPTNNVGDLDAAVQKLVDADVDLILSLSTPATLAAKRVTADTAIPVIFGTVTDPVAVGIVDSLTQPGANVTGIKTGGTESKQLEWLQAIVPELHTIYVPHNSKDASSVTALENIRGSAEKIGVEIVSVETLDRDAVLAALQTMPEDIDGILMLPDSVVVAQLVDIVNFSLERQIPVVGINKEHAEMGTLLAFGPEHFEVGRQSARLASQALSGIDVADLPVEVAEFYLSLNMPTAQSLGVTFSDTTLRTAQHIVR